MSNAKGGGVVEVSWLRSKHIFERIRKGEKWIWNFEKWIVDKMDKKARGTIDSYE